jgi:DNA-binding response OmpR family regulator
VFEEDRKVAIEMGCSDFVRKPFQVAIIFEKMAEFLGVRYRYAEDDSISSETSQPLSIGALTAADLSGMPIDWLNELRQAASRANTKQLLHLIAQMPPAQAQVATALTQLVNDFCFEEIVALIP